MDDGRTIRKCIRWINYSVFERPNMLYGITFWGPFLYDTYYLYDTPYYTYRDPVLPFMLDLSSKPDMEQTDGMELEPFFFFLIPLSRLLFSKLRENGYFLCIRVYIRTMHLNLSCMSLEVCRHTTDRMVKVFQHFLTSRISCSCLYLPNYFHKIFA